MIEDVLDVIMGLWNILGVFVEGDEILGYREFVDPLVEKYGDLVEVVYVSDRSDVDEYISADGSIKMKIVVNTTENNIQALSVKRFTFNELNSIDIGNELIALDITVCKLEQLPCWIGKHTQLSNLSVSNNKLRKLPDFIGNLTRLTSLWLSYNQLNQLPDSLRNLKQLRCLVVLNNPLKGLPEWLGDFKNLKYLDISNLEIPTIPKSLAFLGLNFKFNDGVNGIVLHNTKLTNMDISIFEQPLPLIQAYYEELETNTPTELNECKIIFLGDGKVGKSSLIQRITHPEKDFDENKRATDGISIENIDVKIDETNVKLRIWDFGGQEVMHSMHKCFLTSRTVYVVVLDGRQNQFLNKTALYWLRTIESFAPDCPVIMAINKIDEAKDAAVNETDFKEFFPNLVLPILKTSALENMGIKDLEAQIIESVKISGGYKNPFAKQWFAIKNALENMTTPYIEKDEYVALCEREGLNDSEIQEMLLGWFKDLGISYYYKESDMTFASKDITVLHPDWLTNGIYRLILRSEEGQGFITRDEIEKVMANPHENDINSTFTYKDKEIDFVLAVMEQFEISHHSGDIEFVPLKLPKITPPQVSEFKEGEALHLSWEVNYMPYNAIHRFMIQLFDDMDKDCVWLNGAKFESPDGKKFALVYMDLDEKEIHAFVVSKEENESKEYLDEIRNKLSRILTKLNLKYDENIHYKLEGKNGKVPFTEVWDQFIQKPESNIYLRDTKQYINPRKLLQYAYPEQAYNRSEVTMHYYNNERGNMSVNNGVNINSDVTQTLNISTNWTNNLPDETSITPQQLKEFQKAIESFLESDLAGDMKNKDTKPLKNVLEESKKWLEDAKSAWSIIKNFFSNPTEISPLLIPTFAAFIASNPTIAEWIQLLIK